MLSSPSIKRELAEWVAEVNVLQAREGGYTSSLAAAESRAETAENILRDSTHLEAYHSVINENVVLSGHNEHLSQQLYDAKVRLQQQGSERREQLQQQEVALREEFRFKFTSAMTDSEKHKVQLEDQLTEALDAADAQGQMLAELDSRHRLELASAADECEKHKALLQQQLREALDGSRHDLELASAATECEKHKALLQHQLRETLTEAEALERRRQQSEADLQVCKEKLHNSEERRLRDEQLFHARLAVLQDCNGRQIHVWKYGKRPPP